VRLGQHLTQLEKYGQAGFRELESRRFRYYGEITPASKPGEMIGRRLVREWDASSGATRTWHETVDGVGRVRIVPPRDRWQQSALQLRRVRELCGLVVTESFPSRDSVRVRLLDLLACRASREEVADWASAWIRDPIAGVDDAVVWEALKALAGADLRVNPVDYLHVESDFHAWLDKLEQADEGGESR
jgi:hypothetical protein